MLCPLTDCFKIFVLFLSFSPPPDPNYTECWMIDGGCILSAFPAPRPGTIKPARTVPYTETPYYHVFKTTYDFIHKILQAVVKLLCDRAERIMILKSVR